ncbi:MAG TPA: ADP-ribosylglycohydrolase family protein [Ktedonobacteraceae bacterium]|nr:ADP-ribosylglycohydrolase family protein [Ktedonobacteraceae bacterium]
MSTILPQQRASGCLFGLAFGDALGAATEFLNIKEILERFPPDGPRELAGNPARVTDDTQMTIAVGEALLACEQPYTPSNLELALRKAFVEWSVSPENNRAPGVTCMTACANLARGLPWYEATVSNSKGCGANMRVAPVGLFAQGESAEVRSQRAALAQFQAALTHGHPTGLAASDLTAAAIADLLAGGDPAGLPARLRDYAHSQREVYHADWLGPLWQRVGVDSPQAFIARGWRECLDVLDRLDAALLSGDRTGDPCLATGAGWVAEEALATGLLCFLTYPEEPLSALHRAAVSSGDSDSIACLAGAFAGAHLGLAAWPAAWIERIEYREKLARLGQAWDRPWHYAWSGSLFIS